MKIVRSEGSDTNKECQILWIDWHELGVSIWKGLDFQAKIEEKSNGDKRLHNSNDIWLPVLCTGYWSFSMSSYYNDSLLVSTMYSIVSSYPQSVKKMLTLT